MSYQALLFCPDEKTTRVVTQVLSELDFRVESCNEPFAAVKKLMAQHFDAIVVDCDNEQNAALLFKSARNSPANQNSLSVAVVEGQAGVAKAFRIGANLVLTKPINVEQSKGTLRVARGLLRKADSAKPSALASTGPGATPKTPVAPKALSFESPRLATPAPTTEKPAFLSVTHEAPPVAPAASASAFELEAEQGPAPDAAEAALIESMGDPVSPAHSKPALGSVPQKEYPWQPVSKPLAEPMASALRRAAEVAEKGTLAEPNVSGLSLSTKSKSLPSLGLSAASAPAPAREIKPTEPEVEPIASNNAPSTPVPIHKGLIVDESVEDAVRKPEEIRVPTFGMSQEAHKSSGGAKKGFVAVLLLVLLVAAGYYGWTMMHPGAKLPFVENLIKKYISHEQSAAPVSAPAVATPVRVQAPPISASTTAQTSPAETDLTPGTAQEITVEPATSAQHEPATGTSAAPLTTLPTIHSNPTPAEKAPVAPIVVKNGSANPVAHRPAAEEPEQAPSNIGVTPGTDNKALAGLMGPASAKMPKVAPQTVRVSQGVSQGLLVKKIQPTYPRQALTMRMEGSVQLEATISRTGNITNVKVLSGLPTLAQAAVDAVKQWKYKPYYLNGEPVDIQTQVTVNFKLPN